MVELDKKGKQGRRKRSNVESREGAKGLPFYPRVVAFIKSRCYNLFLSKDGARPGLATKMSST